MLITVWSAAGAAPDLTIEYGIHDGVTSRAVAAMGAPADARGWDRRTLYVSGERSAEYTSGSWPVPGNVEEIARVYIRTPRWRAYFDPGSGVGMRHPTPAGALTVDELIASSDAAQMIERTRLLEHLGPVVGRRHMAGHACDLYQPDPNYVKAELCIASIGGRSVLLYSRWYELETVWMEQARRVDVGSPIPPEKFSVPESVDRSESEP